jgi:hypothetical protein
MTAVGAERGQRGRGARQADSAAAALSKRALEAQGQGSG